MRKFTSLFLILMALSATAGRIQPEEAAAIAADFLNSASTSTTRAGVISVDKADVPIMGEADVNSSPYYIFNSQDNAGFVIISGDDRVKKVLAYSLTGKFEYDNMPPQLKGILHSYAERISNISDNAGRHPSWDSSNTRAEGNSVLMPTVNWGQGYPYNLQTPIVEGEQSLTGCVATAMAIVMQYYAWPPQGRSFSHLYDEVEPQLCEFDQFTFDYSKMPVDNIENADEASKQEVSKLMLAAGRAVNMAYSPQESGAYFEIAAHELEDKFSYSPLCEYLMARDYTTEEWMAKLYNELDNNRLVMYAGDLKNQGRHAFVCDGYSSDGLIHINWGWDGVNNGYYTLDDMLDSDNQAMAVNIEPDRSGKRYARHFLSRDGIYVAFEDSNFINVTVPEIKKGEIFDINLPGIRSPYYYEGNIGVALTDKDGNIKEVIAKLPITHGMAWDYNPFYNEYHLVARNAVVTQDIDADDLLQLVAQEGEDGEWLPILGCSHIKSNMPVVGCTNLMSDVTFDVDPEIIFEVLNMDTNEWYVPTEDNMTIILGGDIHFRGKLAEDDKDAYAVVTIYGKGPYGNEWSFKCNSEKEGEIGYTLSGSYKIVGRYYKYSPAITLTVETPGTLNTLITPEDASKISDLTLKGNINAFDIWYIRENMKGLKKIDMSETVIAEVDTKGMDINSFELGDVQPADYMPEWAFERLMLLNEVKLPTGLKGFTDSSLSGLDIREITLPATIEDFGMNNFFASNNLRVIVNMNPEPVYFRDCNLAMTQCPENGLLMVPEGSVDAYKEAETWKDFKYICSLNAVLPERIEIVADSDDSELAVGSSRQLSVKFYPENVTMKEITWESVYSHSLSIDETGKITGIWPGECEVRVTTANGITASYFVNVVPVMVEALILSSETKEGVIGDTFDLGVVIIPENATFKDLGWYSSDNGVAVVEQNGSVSIVGEGTCDIVVEALDGSAVRSICKVTGTAGIEDIIMDGAALIDVFNLNGVLIKKGCEKENLKDLLPGIYILRQGDKTMKLTFK